VGLIKARKSPGDRLHDCRPEALLSSGMARRTGTSRQRRGPFETTLWRYPGKGGWHFAIVPAKVAPPVTRPWGRTPVTATVDAATWDTSIWRDATSKRSLLAVPKRHRGGKGDGDRVTVTFVFDPDDD
jgi:hypothetical protein